MKKALYILLFVLPIVGFGQVDYYPIENKSTTLSSYNGSVYAYVGQSFYCANTVTLGSVLFSLAKLGSPNGNAYVRIYAHTGTYGSTSKPTGTALATSNTINMSTLSTTWTTFIFSGANRITLTGGTYYCAVFVNPFGSSGNAVRLGVDQTGPTHGGNVVYSSAGSTWSSGASADACFYVYAATWKHTINGVTEPYQVNTVSNYVGNAYINTINTVAK